jgi:hypothetical protein
MPARAVLFGLICALIPMRAFAETNVAAIRVAHFEVLSQQFATARKVDSQSPPNQTEKPEVEHHRTKLFRDFAPKFLALAEENPTDEAALRCCEWIIAYGIPSGSDREFYEADCTAWKMIGQHQTFSERMPLLCAKAAQFPTEERERFLRALPNDYRQPVEVHGMAFLALADLLVKRCQLAADAKLTLEKSSPEWRDYIASGDPQQLLAESEELYRHVLAHYSEHPFPINGLGNTESQTLGELATQKLAALEKPVREGKTLREETTSAFDGSDHLSGN